MVRWGGVIGASVLLDFAEALLEFDVLELNRARVALAADSSIAGYFTKNDRIANGIGISSEPGVVRQTADFRDRFGLMKFCSAKDTFG